MNNTLLKRIIRSIVHKFGFDIVRFDPNQIGKCHLADMKIFLHNDTPLIFDVGANIGQSIEKFREGFPRSTIHSFEPSPTTFELLKQQAIGYKNVHLWNFALGASSGKMTFLENSLSNMSSFLPLSEFGWGKIKKETLVEVQTIDQFCLDQHIEHINILKSDTQGFDLEVFKGAENSIRNNKIALIYFEITFSDMYKNLPSFSELYDFLITRDFLLVSFYPFSYQKQLASWTDALFVHKSHLL